MAGSRPRTLHRVAYWALLATVSLWTLALFVRPTPRHLGTNEYERSLFVPMVEGTAYKPYVYRALLPLLTRGLSALVPERSVAALTATIENQAYARRGFARLHWEAAQTHRYAVAALLMFLCYVGFAHYAARLTIHTCALADTLQTRAAIALVALLGLPSLFRYVSFIYDPPQLFLFTLALYLLATRQAAKFNAVFVLCCINKETAVLLIPIWAVTFRGTLPAHRYYAVLAFLVLCWVVVKLALLAAYRSNPGEVAEFHFFDHNLPWLTRPWPLLTLASWCLCAWFFLFSQWKKRPAFLRLAIVCTLPPVVTMAFLFGYIDEWRAFYEAYPVAIALATDSARRLLSAPGAGGAPA